MVNSYLLFGLVFALVQAQTNAPTKPNLTAEEVLARYERSLSFMAEKVSFDADGETTFNGAFKLQQKKAIHRRTICRDRSRFAAFVETKAFDDEQRLLWHNKTSSIVGSEEMMSYNAPAGEAPVALLIDSQPERLKRGLVLNVGAEMVLDGITIGDDGKSFIEVMRLAPSLRLTPEMEVVDGYLTYVLEADTKYGKHILWIDPECGFNPRRIVIRKTVGDFYHKTKVGDPPPPLPPKWNPAIPWCAKIKTELIVDSIKIEKSGELFVPISARILERMDYENGQFTEEINTYRRTNINFNPNFDDMMQVFLANIPDGTPVFFQDGRGLSGVRHEWFNGEVRAKVDEAFLDDLDNQIEQLKSEVKKEESTPTADTQTEIQPDITEPQTEVLSETRLSAGLVLIPIGLLIIAIIAWRVLLLKRR